jgi:hypothetical protein
MIYLQESKRENTVDASSLPPLENSLQWVSCKSIIIKPGAFAGGKK